MDQLQQKINKMVADAISNSRELIKNIVQEVLSAEKEKEYKYGVDEASSQDTSVGESYIEYDCEYNTPDQVVDYLVNSKFIWGYFRNEQGKIVNKDGHEWGTPFLNNMNFGQNVELKPKAEGPKGCVCKSSDLFAYGCKCGGS